MKASTTIEEMIDRKKIIVPNYQRAYSWDTPIENIDRETHTDVFLSDLEEYKDSDANSQYHFGHFLFEQIKDKDEKFYVIDGQQRLTTIVIFLSALFKKLKNIRNLNDDEEVWYENLIKRRNAIRFSTVHYDKQLFIDYVIEQTKSDHNGLETESARRIVKAFDFFEQKLSDKPEEYLTSMLDIIRKSTCTTHQVQDESTAIQMFIFQNNRGKRPTNLEIVKAQFMYNVHLYGGDCRDVLIGEIRNRFEKIYKSISSIEYHINEDDVLLYTLRVYFHSLWEPNAPNALDRINKKLLKEDRLNFIRSFTRSLEDSFLYLSIFFGDDEQKNFEIHSLITLGGIAIALPFIIKAYKYDLPLNAKGKLCSSLENLVLRHRLIGTKAYMRSRINGVFEAFTKNNKDISPIIDQIKRMKTALSESESWWAYWNDDKLRESLQGAMNHSVAKYLLWKYEIHLKQQGNAGYNPARYDSIDLPQLEHIAPTTEPEGRPHGYDNYDDEFKNQYLNCLGNYLLISKSHNCAIGNTPFAEKRASYEDLKQHREIQDLVPENGVWSKEIIQERKEKIIAFIMDNF